MVVYYVNNFGFIQPFQVFQADGVTVLDLTGATVTWLFKDNTVKPAVTKSIAGNITNAAQGQFNCTIPQNFFNTVTKYDCQIQVSSLVLLIDTDPPFVVEIIQSET